MIVSLVRVIQKVEKCQAKELSIVLQDAALGLGLIALADRGILRTFRNDSIFCEHFVLILILLPTSVTMPQNEYIERFQSLHGKRLSSLKTPSPSLPSIPLTTTPTDSTTTNDSASAPPEKPINSPKIPKPSPASEQNSTRRSATMKRYR